MNILGFFNFHLKSDQGLWHYNWDKKTKKTKQNFGIHKPELCVFANGIFKY